MQIALAQLNPTVGDIPGNTALILDAAAQARRDGADVLVCGEMAIVGYPPRDLLLREGVVEACEAAVREIAEQAGDLTILVGHPRRQVGGVRSIRNSVSVCRGGEIVAVADKRLLPGYDVFDEDRYFDPGEQSIVVEINGTRAGLLICEDLWRARDVDARSDYPVDPVSDVVGAGCDLLISINASPFIMGKAKRHLRQLQDVARRVRKPIICVNQVGANDDLVFDGRSCVVSKAGEALAMLPAFESAVRTVDLGAKPQSGVEPLEPMAELYGALVVAVRDYVHKTKCSDVLLGLSGGVDSAVSAVIAVAAVGPEHVNGVLMPSMYSSRGSVDDARALAENLQLRDTPVISIESAHALLREVLGKSLGAIEGTMTDENVQARLRGLLLMALSNSRGALVLSTSNKSEVAVGYSTLYGDMVGALAVLGDVLKTRVYELAEWINANHRSRGFSVPPIPRESITKPPSAELRPNQTDQDTLPPYDTLDVIVERYIEREQSCERIVAETGLDAELVETTIAMIDRAQYKREQASVIPKVSARAFGRGRVVPIVGRFQAQASKCPTAAP